MADIEDVFEALAITIDAVGAERTPLFLAKLALALAQALDDPVRAMAIISAAAADEPGRGTA